MIPPSLTLDKNFSQHGRCTVLMMLHCVKRKVHSTALIALLIIKKNNNNKYSVQALDSHFFPVLSNMKNLVFRFGVVCTYA